MKAYKNMCIAVITVFLLLTAVLNIFLVGAKDSSEGIYRVEAKRLADEISQTGSYDLEKYPHITGVFTGDGLYRSDEHYLIIEIGETLYRVEYTVGSGRHGMISLTKCSISSARVLMLSAAARCFSSSLYNPLGELITVSNTGCTLETKELPQIFESFHRGNNADKVQGNGLGLFICKRVMSLMGGEVFADIRTVRQLPYFSLLVDTVL